MEKSLFSFLGLLAPTRKLFTCFRNCKLWLNCFWNSPKSESDNIFSFNFFSAATHSTCIYITYSYNPLQQKKNPARLAYRDRKNCHCVLPRYDCWPKKKQNLLVHILVICLPIHFPSAENNMCPVHQVE